MDTTQRQALERLIAIAKRDTGQSRPVANLLLSCGTAELAEDGPSPTFGPWIEG